MPALTFRSRSAALLAAAVLGTVGVFAAALLPAFASPGDDEKPDAEFRVAGDGSLPETPPPLRAPHEPLSSAERAYAIYLARQAMAPGAEDVRGKPGGEVLVAELPPLSERTDSRLVAVAAFDYTTDRLHQMLLDLTQQTVLSDQSAQELQLPPSAVETKVALELAMEAAPAPAFFEEYQETTGHPLETPKQVHAVAGVWRAVDDTAARSDVTEVCGRHRCLQLLLALPSGQYLDTQDFAVDLSTRTVLPVEPGTPDDSDDEDDHEH